MSDITQVPCYELRGTSASSAIALYKVYIQLLLKSTSSGCCIYAYTAYTPGS